MNATASDGSASAFKLLRRLARNGSPVELCDFCSVPLAPKHRHLLEVQTRKTVCVCAACALRFEGAIGKWKLIPRDTRRLLGFQVSEGQWQALGVPIDLAFFFASTPAERVLAMYPSPAGATESLLPLSSWEGLVAANPPLARLEPDVEALLANRVGPSREYYIAPIDVCFELVGLLRTRWRGLSGGDKVWREIDDFFLRLNESATTVTCELEAAHA